MHRRLASLWLTVASSACGPSEHPTTVCTDTASAGRDLDGDGFAACGVPIAMLDCNDRLPDIYPGAPEGCDGVDTDCDGAPGVHEVDADRDGFSTCDGDCDDSDPALHPADFDGDGVSTCGGDCDDSDPMRGPWASELCNGRDDSCRGVVAADELDLDGDGQAECAGDCDDQDAGVHGLDLDRDGFTLCGTPRDCDDRAALVFPGAAETCDRVDNDCDGVVDNGCE